MIEKNELVQAGELVFDIGANEGLKTQEYVKLGARVVAFEANPELAMKLNIRFAANTNVFIENKALAGECGVVALNICSQAHTLSTCNLEWAVGRFKEYVWDKKVNVPSVSMDAAIAFFGVPHFIKIDVEGFELQVLSGLSRPVDFLCFEFTIEFANNMVACLEHLATLGMGSFNVGIGEDTLLYSPKWLSAAEIKDLVADLGKANPDLWGDVYARKG
jgi:FkbM family methyltransferase